MASTFLNRSAPIAVAPAIVAAGVLGAAATLDTERGTTFCFFRICTGGYCPGCGGGRAAVALARGDLGASWTLHPWVLLIAVQGVLAALAVAHWGRHRLRSLLVPVLLFNLLFGLTLWVARLASGSIPAPF